MSLYVILRSKTTILDLQNVTLTLFWCFVERHIQVPVTWTLKMVTLMTSLHNTVFIQVSFWCPNVIFDLKNDRFHDIFMFRRTTPSLCLSTGHQKSSFSSFPWSTYLVAPWYTGMSTHLNMHKWHTHLHEIMRFRKVQPNSHSTFWTNPCHFASLTLWRFHGIGLLIASTIRNSFVRRD